MLGIGVEIPRPWLTTGYAYTLYRLSVVGDEIYTTQDGHACHKLCEKTIWFTLHPRRLVIKTASGKFMIVEEAVQLGEFSDEAYGKLCQRLKDIARAAAEHRRPILSH